MSTAVLEMQPFNAQHPHADLDFNIGSKTASMYGTSGPWASSPQANNMSMTMADYVGFPVTNARPSGCQFALQSNYQQTQSNDHGFRNNPTSECSSNDFKTQPNTNTPLSITTREMYSSPAMFTASNVQMNTYDAATISPMDTRFDVDHASPGSDTKPSFSHMHHTQPSNYATFINDTEHSSSKRRCDSLQSNFESQSPTMSQSQVGRRRGSEYVEPGSARAVYLEKNRKAASKCRNKQKRQQEELVEAARDVERRNKILKAEVEMLKSGMRDLMELVGQHTNCPDARLNLYVQREADRLATVDQRNALPSSSSGSSYSGHSFVDKASSGSSYSGHSFIDKASSQEDE